MHAHVFVRKEHIASNIWTFWFENTPAVAYQAGQFVGVTLAHTTVDNRGAHRWFTLSSSPTEPLLGITTRVVPKPSSFMHNLNNLQSGDLVTLSDAMGDFVLPMNKKTPLLFVIAGIGITPVKSMLQWLKDSGEQRDITVLYATASKTDLAYTSLLEAVGSVQYFTTDHASKFRLTSHTVMQVASEQPTGLVYVSGPELFVEQMVDDLRAAGLAVSRLVTDYFPGYEN